MLTGSSHFLVSILLLSLCSTTVIIVFLWQREKRRNAILKNEISRKNKVAENAGKRHSANLQTIRDSLSNYAVIKYAETKEAERLLCESKREILLLQKEIEELQIKCNELQNVIAGIRKVSRSVIHDLKSPLNIILHNADQDNISEKNITEIRKASHEMLSLIMNILELERSGKSGMILNFEDFDLTEIMESLLTRYRTILNSSSVETCTSSPLPCYVHADKIITERILENLLSNAVRFTPPFGKIELSATEVNQQIRIEVRDNGSGMQTQLQDKIFEEFVGDDSKAFTYSNPTGIGLSFCKMAVEAHGGKIGIITKEGEGTRVWFFLEKSRLSISGKPVSRKTGHSTPHNLINEDDIKLIREKLDFLKKTDIHEVSTIVKTLNDSVFTQNARISEWKTALEAAVFSQDEALYSRMIGI